MKLWLAFILDCLVFGVFAIAGVFISVSMIATFLFGEGKLMAEMAEEGPPTAMSFLFAALLVVSASALAVFSLFRVIQATRRYLRGCCEQCGYDLRGCVEPGCPECGWGREKAEE